jgi:hypothetical protein
MKASPSLHICTKLNQQLKIMVSELTDIVQSQEIVSNKCGCSKKDGRSKTSMVVYNPDLTALPFDSISDKSEKLTLLFQTGVKTRHIILAEIINSGVNYNSVISSVPNDRATVLKNPLNFSKNKLSLKVIQTSPDICDCVQVFNLIYERELLFSLQLFEFNTCGNASHQNTMGVGQSSSDICPHYLQQIFIKANTEISLCKFLEIFSSALNSQYVLDSGSSEAHTVLCVSNIPDLSASEDNCAESETSGRLADKISMISSYCNDVVENRASKLIGNANLLTTWQGKSLQTVNNIFWSALPTNLHNKEVCMCTSHRSCFNASCCWQEGYRRQILETYNAKTKNNQIQTDCLQKHYCTEGDCTYFNECNRKINFFKGCDVSDKKVIHVDSVPFKSDVLLQKDAVTTENDVSASLEQHNFEVDGSEPSNITRQKKLMGMDSLYDLHDFITEGTDKTITSFRKHPIILSQKIRSFSQPSLPTYLLYNSTDDEQLSEDTENGSDSLSDTATACENIHHENISELMGHLVEDIKENWQLEMPYSATNSYETTEETEIADSNQNVYMVESDHLDTNVGTELVKNVSFIELFDKSQKLHTKNYGFCEEKKLSCPPPFEMNTSINDHEVPSGSIQGMNTWYREEGNALEMESHISQGITGIEVHVNKREYPRNIKQHLLFPQSQNEIFSGNKVIPDGNIQCGTCILPNISSWNGPENKTCTEKAKTCHSHATLSACTDCTRDANIQCKVHALTLPSDTDTNKRQVDKTTCQKHEPQVDICHLTETDRINSRYESCKIRGNMYSPDYVTTQRVQMSPRPYSPDIMCSSNFSQSLPGQDHTVFPTSDAESVSNSGEDNYYQEQPMAYPCIQNRHSHNQMSQVHNSSPENTLHSCIDLAIKEYENDIHKQPCCTELQPTQDVTVQTNIRSLITSENQNCCFVCFSNNSNQFNNKDLKDGTHRNLALKRHIEALYLESVSLHKKQRYDTLKLMESHISELHTNHTSRLEKYDIIEGSSCNDDNEDINFKYEEYLPKVQDTSVININDFVNFDRNVPDVGKDVSWMDDDVSQRELYVTDQIMKGKWTILFITVLNNLSFSLPS